MESLTPPAIYSIIHYTMIHVFELPTLFIWGGKAPNQLLDGLAPPRDVHQLPCMRAGGAGLLCLRGFQYSRIANFPFRGTEAHHVPPTCPTMTLVRIANDTTISPDHRRMILHEFGHLLGLLDEIQNPNAKIPLRPGIRAGAGITYAYVSQIYKCPAPLNRPITYQESLPQYRPFDPTSIMMVPIGKEYLTEDVSYGGASGLSTNDKEFVAHLYPK